MTKLINFLINFLKRINEKDKEREKKFLKLKQLDRIEYGLESKSIKEYYALLSSSFLNSIFVLNITLFLFATIFLIAFKSTSLIEITPIFFKLSMVALIFVIFLDILRYFTKRKSLFNLRERFNLN